LLGAFFTSVVATPARPARARRRGLLLLGLSGLLASTPAYAQFGGGGGGGMRPGGMNGSPTPTETKEGPAETAPNEAQAESPALQPLPAWPQQKEKATQFFQINGYLRGRAYLFHALNLGVYQGTSGPASPFYIPYTEYGQSGKVADNGNISSCAQREQSNCRTSNLTSADMRFRLEPTINVTDSVRVKAQIDVFDNLVLGSSPQSYSLDGATQSSIAAATGQTISQVSPQAGSNAVFDSIRAKRAWAEVRTPWAEIRFGRMPSHWGMGMLENNGDCLDCDYGVNADRVMVATKLWGHFFAFMWDWVATGPTTQLLNPQQGQGVYYNADTLDDVSQWRLAMGKMDKPEELAEKVAKGRVVVNYGGYFTYRQQDWAQKTNFATETQTYQSLQDNITPRHAKAFIGDVWWRLNWKKLHLEVEGALQAGKIGNLNDVDGRIVGSTQLLAGGLAFKGDYKLLHDALKIFLEIGYASGDSNEDPTANLNSQTNNPIPTDNKIHRFMFDPDYHVDLLFFRRILGTVNNAAYYKAGISYDILDNFTARADVLYDMAANPIAYPGNSYNLGVEIDATLMYRNEEDGFYAGIAYGVLFPFHALALPGDIYGSQFEHDPRIAQTFQGRVAVKF
jgi:uncharacterized protein (TIGR04551 family)